MAKWYGYSFLLIACAISNRYDNILLLFSL